MLKKYWWFVVLLLLVLVGLGIFLIDQAHAPATLSPDVRVGKHFVFPLIVKNYPLATSTPEPTLTPIPTPIPTATPEPTATLVPLLAKVSGIAWPREDTYDRSVGLAQIGAKITLDWGYKASTAQVLQTTGVTYLPMQWSCNVNVASVQAFARQFPGSTWLAFNEPDNTDQANCTPEQAAKAYNLLYESIKAVDTSARLFCCGTAFYPAHIDFMKQWAQTYRDLYGNWPVIDGIHLHSYGQFEDRLDAPRRKYELEQTRAWTQQQSWAANKPFIVSEWAVSTASWWKFKDQDPIVNYYIPDMRKWFDQQVWIIADIWFSSWYSEYYYEPDNIWYQASSTLTPTGKAWQKAAP